MKRYNEKFFIKTGILDELKKHTFYKGKQAYLFYCWNYEKGIYTFIFRKIEDIDKSLYENCESLCIRLYYQHYNNYENTLELLYQFFDKIESLKGEN